MSKPDASVATKAAWKKKHKKISWKCNSRSVNFFNEKKDFCSLIWQSFLFHSRAIILNFMQLFLFHINSSLKVKAIGHCAISLYSWANTIITRFRRWVNKLRCNFIPFNNRFLTKSNQPYNLVWIGVNYWPVNTLTFSTGIAQRQGKIYAGKSFFP